MVFVQVSVCQGGSVHRARGHRRGNRGIIVEWYEGVRVAGGSPRGRGGRGGGRGSVREAAMGRDEGMLAGGRIRGVIKVVGFALVMGWWIGRTG